MSEIRVTPSELRNKAEYLAEKNSAFQKYIGDLESKEGELIGQWEGDAKTEFDKAFKTDKVKFDEFHKLIETYISTLRDIAKKYEEAESRNADKARTRR